jgi:hypothetical protein
MIAVTKSRFALAEQHFIEREFAPVEWLPDRRGIRFDDFVITITSCRAFCDGHHIAPIASVLPSGKLPFGWSGDRLLRPKPAALRPSITKGKAYDFCEDDQGRGPLVGHRVERTLGLVAVGSARVQS